MKGNRIFSKKFGLILLLPSALIFLLVSVYPLCTGLILSFQNNSLFSSDQANFIGIQNLFRSYRQIQNLETTFYLLLFIL